MKNIICSLTLFSLMLVSATASNAQDDHLSAFEMDILRDWLKVLSNWPELEEVTFLKALIAQPMPAEYANAPAKASAWKAQTAWIERVQAQVVSFARGLKEELSDNRMSWVVWLERCSAYSSFLTANPDPSGTGSGAIRKRHEDVTGWYNALTKNESLKR